MKINIFRFIILSIIFIAISNNFSYAIEYDYINFREIVNTKTVNKGGVKRTAPEVYRAWGNRQEVRRDKETGRVHIIQHNYQNYAERNEHVSEKVVVIYDKHSPAYGYRYTLYTPIKLGKKWYVGHHKQMQQSLSGFGLEPIPDGGPDSGTPCFESIEQVKHYYYPKWY